MEDRRLACPDFSRARASVLQLVEALFDYPQPQLDIGIHPDTEPFFGWRCPYAASPRKVTARTGSADFHGA